MMILVREGEGVKARSYTVREMSVSIEGAPQGSHPYCTFGCRVEQLLIREDDNDPHPLRTALPHRDDSEIASCAHAYQSESPQSVAVREQQLL